MNALRIPILLTSVVAILASTAPAGTITIVPDSGAFAGYVVNDIQITVSGEWTGMQLRTADLGAGAIYQNPVSGDVPPSQALVNAIPDVAFDSFMANGGLISDTSGDVLVVGASANLNGDGTKRFSDSQIDVTWAPQTGLHPTGLSNYTVARITLGAGVNGQFDLLLATEGGKTIVFGNTISNGQMAPVPEPGSLVLSILGVLGLAFCIRRRKR